MSFSLGKSAQASESLRTKKLGILANAVQQLNLGGTKQGRFQVQSKESNDDFAVTDLDNDIDRFVIDKTTGNLDTNGGDMTVNTLNYTALNPPVGGGGGVQNPMTVDLDTANFLVGDSTYGKTLLTDTAPPTSEKAVYDESIITGAYNRQPVSGMQENFNPITGFPTSLRCQMENNLYSQAINGVFSRRTALNLPPGLAGNYLVIGNQLGFTDRVTYDPLNMRFDPTVPNAWTAVKFSENLGAICPGPIGTQSKMIVEIHTHMEGSWASLNPNNILKIYARHYRTAGVLRDYQISLITGNAQDVVRSDSRYLMAFSPALGEDFQNDDYLEVFLENDPTSPNDFTVALFKCGIQVRPCP